ncbi:MAG: hypothetical protein WCS52_12795 [bacterium]
MQDVWITLGVLTSFTLLYLLPLWLPAKRFLAPGPWPVTAAAALLLGLTVQSVYGLIWTRCIRHTPYLEGAGFLVICAALTLAAILLPRRASPLSSTIPKGESGLLAAILLIGILVRSLHPLQHWALGQSDAYTHLTMVREVLAWGYIGNSSYPAGFAWIMSLPALAFHWDPYYLARFGGPFFGSAMVLAVYALLRLGSKSGVAALCGAACVAWFPGLMLLIKTGVGTFANQIGFIVLPLLWLGYLLARVPETRSRGILWLVAGFTGLALTVPMMLLHVYGVLLLLLLIDGAGTRQSVWQRGRLILLLMTVGLGLLAFHMTHMTPWQRAMTAIHLTGANQTTGPLNANPESMTTLLTLEMLGRDFLAIKRVGLHSALLDSTLIGLIALWLCALVWGVRRKQPLTLLLGCWGGLACVQVATGWLQFTAYQREGWSLLIAVGAMGGTIAGALWDWRTGLRPLLLSGLVASGAWTLSHPPGHPLLNSSAEDELVRTIRLLRSFPHRDPSPDTTSLAAHQFLAQHLDPHQKLGICSRSLIQSDVYRAITGFNPRLTFYRIVEYNPLPKYMALGNQFLIVLDKPEDLVGMDFGVFGTISPALKENYVEQQRRRYATNLLIETTVAGLPRDLWDVHELAVSPRLRIIVASRVTPLAKAPSAQGLLF